MGSVRKMSLYFTTGCILWLGTHTAAQSYYPVDWEDAMTVRSRDYSPNVDLGPCECDLTWNLCDVNCHCDPECTVLEISRFSDGSCTDGLQNGDETGVDCGGSCTPCGLRRCVDKNLVRSNRRGKITEVLLENLLCIEIDNNPAKGNFYEPEAVVLDDGEKQRIRNAHSFTFLQDDRFTGVVSADDDVYFQIGDRIQMAYDVEGVLEQAGAGYLPMPSDFMGLSCSRESFMQYGVPGVTTCSLRVEDVKAMCVPEGVLGVGGLGLERNVAKLRSSTAADQEQWVSINIVGVRYVQQELITSVRAPDLTGGFANITITDAGEIGTDNSTGAPTARPTVPRVVRPTTQGPTNTPTGADAPPATEPVSTENQTSSPTVKWTIDVGELPPMAWNEETCACENAIVGVSNIVIHELIGSITRVDVELILNSVTGELGCLGGGADVPRTFSSRFQLVDTVVPPQPKSGNPGYAHNYPLLAGNLAVDETVDENGVTRYSEAVKRDRVGLTLLPSDSTGRCQAPTYAGQGTLVRYAEDLRVGCMLALNFDELRNLCENPKLLLPYFFVTTPWIGKWGDSDSANKRDWLELEFEDFTPTAEQDGEPVEVKSTEWIEATGECRGLRTSVNLEFFTQRVGAEDNPQDQILAGSVSYSSSTWTFPKIQRGVNSLAMFPLTATTTYLQYLEEEVVNFVPAAPPIFPKFPRDLLYPLYISGSERVKTSTGALVLVPLLLSFLA